MWGTTFVRALGSRDVPQRQTPPPRPGPIIFGACPLEPRERRRRHRARRVDHLPGSLLACRRRNGYGPTQESLPENVRGAVAKQALGMIETRGYVGAVEAADAMCKT